MEHLIGGEGHMIYFEYDMSDYVKGWAKVLKNLIRK